jgi:hypothetical protein
LKPHEDLFAAGFFSMSGRSHCAATGTPLVDRRDPRLSALLAEDLAGLPSA